MYKRILFVERVKNRKEGRESALTPFCETEFSGSVNAYVSDESAASLKRNGTNGLFLFFMAIRFSNETEHGKRVCIGTTTTSASFAVRLPQ